MHASALYVGLLFTCFLLLIVTTRQGGVVIISFARLIARNGLRSRPYSTLLQCLTRYHNNALRAMS